MARIYAENRIRELRLLKGFTQGELAERLESETTGATIAKLETRTMALSADYVVGIAKALAVHPGELFKPIDLEAKCVPILPAAKASGWKESARAAKEQAEIPSDIDGSNLFALRVEGDCVDHIAREGGIIVIDPDDIDLVDGKVYLIESQPGQPVARRFTVSPPSFQPISSNPDYAPIALGREPFITVGRVIYAAFPL